MARWISLGLLGAGLLAASVFGIFWINGKEAIARAAAAKAESEEAAATAAERKARSDADAAAKREAAKANEAKTAEERRLAQESATEQAKADAVKAEADAARAAEEKAKAVADRARAEAESEKASAERATALAAKETARLEAAKAKALAEAEALNAQASADALAREKLVADKIIAEAKIYEMRQIDLDTMERELLDYKRELDEREAALRPEKTIKDLDTLGTADDAAAKTAEAPYLAENDMSLPLETRAYEKALRLSNEGLAAVSGEVRSEVVARLEKLYVEAIRDDRVVDADHYRKQLKSMYPDWKYSPKEKETKKEANEK